MHNGDSFFCIISQHIFQINNVRISRHDPFSTGGGAFRELHSVCEVRLGGLLENKAGGWQTAAKFLRHAWCLPQDIYSTKLEICFLLPCRAFAGPTDQSFWNPGLFHPFWGFHTVYTLTLPLCPTSFVFGYFRENSVEDREDLSRSWTPLPCPEFLKVPLKYVVLVRTVFRGLSFMGIRKP